MRRVFLTGASSGIGLAIAKLLVEEGHEVWGTSRNLERIPKMPRLHAIRLDLADPALDRKRIQFRARRSWLLRRCDQQRRGRSF